MGAFRGPDFTTARAQLLETNFVFAFEFPEWHKDAVCQEDGYNADDWGR